MPIKFRCEHCRQFLGISRSKAGDIFDCPSCGRSIRVPDLDGTVRPLPKPGLDRRDVKLSEALGAVADLARPSPGFSASDSDEFKVPEREIKIAASLKTGTGGLKTGAGGLKTGAGGLTAEDAFSGMQTHDEPPVIEPLIPPGGSASDSGSRHDPEHFDWPDSRDQESGDGGSHSVDASEGAPFVPGKSPFRRNNLSPSGFDPSLADQSFDPSVELSDDRSDERSDDQSDDPGRPRNSASTAQPGESWKRLIAAAELSQSARSSASDPASAEPNSSADRAATGPMNRRGDNGIADGVAVATARPRSGPLRMPAMGWLTVIGAGLLFLSVGFWTGRITGIPAVENREADKSDAGDQTGGATGLNVPDKGVAGRITFRAESGVIAPDAGARIILLPVQREGSIRIPHAGLRENDSAADRRGAEAVIASLGGATALTDVHGTFSIKLVRPGEYLALILSNSVTRPDGATTSATDESLAAYFERPAAVLGELAFDLSRIRVSGSDVCPLDCSFR